MAEYYGAADRITLNLVNSAPSPSMFVIMEPVGVSVVLQPVIIDAAIAIL